MLTAALGTQGATMKHMNRVATVQGDVFTDDGVDPGITGAVLHAPQQPQPECE